MQKVFNQLEEVVVEDPEVNLERILKLPNFVVKYLDTDARLRLRKTSSTIRQYLDTEIHRITSLTYKCYGDFIAISTNDGFCVSYEVIEEGLRMTVNDYEKLITAPNEDQQIDVIYRDLMTILGNQKLRIDTLRIENDQEYHAQELFNVGMRALQYTGEQLPNKLIVKNLDYSVYEIDDKLVEIMEQLDPKHLESLYLRFDIMGEAWIADADRIFDLEQWEQLKSVDFDFSFLTLEDLSEHYTHMENVHLQHEAFRSFVDDPPIHDEVMELKEKLLQNPNLEQFTIRVDEAMRDSDWEEIKATLQQFTNTPYPCWISFPYPDSEKKLEMLVKRKMIWFKGPCYVEGEEEEEDEDEEENPAPHIFILADDMLH